MNEPMIVTLKIDEASQGFFDEQRKAYFPAHVNYLDAHLTLFHVLPATEKVIRSTLTTLSKRTRFMMQADSVKNTGNGVAYSILSRELMELHALMQKHFEPYLIAQDKQRLWPHITIQNKVTAFKALSLYEKLQTPFNPFKITATGFSAWIYLKGPWKHVEDFMFENPDNVQNDK